MILALLEPFRKDPSFRRNFRSKARGLPPYDLLKVLVDIHPISGNEIVDGELHCAISEQILKGGIGFQDAFRVHVGQVDSICGLFYHCPIAGLTLPQGFLDPLVFGGLTMSQIAFLPP